MNLLNGLKKLKKKKNNRIMYATTSPNRSVSVRRLMAARLRKTQSGLRPLWVLLRHIFLRPKKCLL